MKYHTIIFSCALVALASCQGSPAGKTTGNDNTTIKVSEDTSQPDTVRSAAPAFPSYSVEVSDPAIAERVKMALQAKFKDDLSKYILDSASRKFAFFAYDLNGDGKREMLVALRGMYFCGSGCCSPLLLDDQGKSITQFSVSEYPIVADNVKTKGWKDLFIASNGKFHIMKFDGRKYPSNPSVQPVLKLFPGDGLPRLLDVDHEPFPCFDI